MRIKLLMILCGILLCQTLSVHAQNVTGKITGTVLDPVKQPLPGATVILRKAGDTLPVNRTLTNQKGEFSFEKISAGNYAVSVSVSGYETRTIEPVTLRGGESAAVTGPVELQAVSKSLSNITVSAKKPFIETRIDKTVVNVDASPTSAGATALEVLEKSPGISVSNDGIISLRGKSGVIVMMDGKPSYLSPADLANLLKNMPASAIDQIEIMTNPSARYDASGNSGVINIRSKKGKNNGLNGSVMAGLTTSFFQSKGGSFYVIPKTQNSINFNWRKNKFNLFGNYNPNVFKGMNQLTIHRVKLDADKHVLGYNDVATLFRFGNNNHTLKLGLDYTPDKKNTIGIVLSGFAFNGHPTPRTTTTSYDEFYQPLSEMVSLTENRLHFRNLSANLNFRHQFDTTGQELTADADWIGYSNISNMQLTTGFYDGTGQATSADLVLRGHLPSDIRIFSLKSDYVKPLKKSGKLEAGFKSSFVRNDNLVAYDRWSNDKWVTDARSNHFIYDEDIQAAYLNVSGQKSNWTYQGGLRLENTLAKGYQVTNDSSFRRQFTSLFPSAFLSYAINKNNSVTLSYSRRITRPNYQDLNPFIYFLDSLSYRKGNPFLLPQFTDNIELSHSFKNKFITTLNYNTTRNVISQLIKPDGDILYLTADNVARYTNAGLALTIPVTITPWWNLNVFTNVFRNHYKGIYNNKPLDLAYTSFMVNMTQSFTIKKGFTAELSGFYRAKTVEQLSVSEPMYVLNAGLQKQVMKGKGTLRLNLRDPFWLQRYNGYTRYDIVDTRIANRWDNRQVTTSFTWRFGKNGQAAPRKHANASQDEQNRVGQGQ